jgi:hypothetical protein
LNVRLIESSKRLVEMLKSHADNLDQLADTSDEPERSYYRSRAQAARSDANNEEAKLKALGQS